MKAKTIDRLQLTKKKFAALNKNNLDKDEQAIGLGICPNCGATGLRRDGGCMSCLSCGWSACG